MTRRSESRRPRTAPEQKERGGSRAEREPTKDDALDLSWDQPATDYPAPERPRDRAEERKRSA